MKSTLTILSLSAALILSPVAFAAPTEDKPGKESTTTSVPTPKPDAPAAKGSSDARPGADDVSGKKSTSTAVPVAPGKDTGAGASTTPATSK